MHSLIAIALLAFLPPDTSPKQAAKPQPVTLEILEARLIDTQQIIRDQNRSLYKLAFLSEELLERLERLEAVEHDRRKPMGLRWIPGVINHDGSEGDGRWEVIWPGGTAARGDLEFGRATAARRDQLESQLNERLANMQRDPPHGKFPAAAPVKRWHPPRQNCDEDDFTSGYWE